MPDPTPPVIDDGAPDPATGGESDPPSGQSGQENQIQALTRKLRKLERQEAERAKADEEQRTAELSDADKLKKRIAELESEKSSLQSKHQDTLKQTRFEAAASKAGAHNPAELWRLADTSAIEIDESGNVSGIDFALKSLQKSSPYLFGAASPPVSSGGGNTAGNTAPKFDEETIRAMNPAQFREFRAKVESGAIKL